MSIGAPGVVVLVDGFMSYLHFAVLESLGFHGVYETSF